MSKNQRKNFKKKSTSAPLASRRMGGRGRGGGVGMVRGGEEEPGGEEVGGPRDGEDIGCGLIGRAHGLDEGGFYVIL